MRVELLGVPGCGKTSVIRAVEERLGYRSNLPPRTGWRDAGRSLRVASGIIVEAMRQPTPSPIRGIHPGSLAGHLIDRSTLRITGRRFFRTGKKDTFRKLQFAFAYHRSFTLSDHDTPFLVDGGPMRRLVQWFSADDFFEREWVHEVAPRAGAYVVLLGDDPKLVQARRKLRTKARYRYKERPDQADSIHRENSYLRKCSQELLDIGVPVLRLDHGMSIGEKAASIDVFLQAAARNTRPLEGSVP